MTSINHRFSLHLLLAFLATLAIFCSQPAMGGGLFGHKSKPAQIGPCQPTVTCYIPPPTAFWVHDDQTELVVRVVGPEFSDLEVYFKLSEPYQNVKKDMVTGATNLHLNNSLAFAPANPAGTFAVRYGPCNDMFRIYSWTKEASELNVFGPCSPEPGYPVCLEFVTPRLLRVSYGRCGSKTRIYRCIPNSNVWLDTEKSLAPNLQSCPQP